MQNQNIKIKLKNLTKEPGVYKMLDKSGVVIYVGKAKNLKNRVSNYFISSNHNTKTQLLQKNIDCALFGTTNLEHLNLIGNNYKQYKDNFSELFVKLESMF